MGTKGKGKVAKELSVKTDLAPTLTRLHDGNNNFDDGKRLTTKEALTNGLQMNQGRALNLLEWPTFQVACGDLLELAIGNLLG